MDESKRELVRCYRLLRSHGYNDSHSGNASVRVADTVWITPAGAGGDTLEPGELIACRRDGEPPPGASLDAALHLAVYRARPEAAAVLHSHGPHAIALSLAGSELVPVDFEGAAYFGRVPVVDVAWADHVERAPAAVAEALAAHPAVIARGHGIYARGETLERAYQWNCSLEASARIAWLARVAGIAG